MKKVLIERIGIEFSPIAHPKVTGEDLIEIIQKNHLHHYSFVELVEPTMSRRGYVEFELEVDDD